MAKGFTSADRGQLISTCGTGKTLTALFIPEKLEATRTPNGHMEENSFGVSRNEVSRRDYVGVRGELGDLRSATANLILVVDTLLSRMQTHRDKEGYGYDSHNGSGIYRGTRGHCRSQEAFAVKELLSKGIRLLVAPGVTLWVILNSPVAWAGPGG
uniref:hypothetical protein n=1 Tax=Mycobacterium sp. TaxID=1785 RepID=UPI003F9B6FD8